MYYLLALSEKILVSSTTEWINFNCNLVCTEWNLSWLPRMRLKLAATGCIRLLQHHWEFYTKRPQTYCCNKIAITWTRKQKSTLVALSPIVRIKFSPLHQDLCCFNMGPTNPHARSFYYALVSTASSNTTHPMLQHHTPCCVHKFSANPTTSICQLFGVSPI